MNKELERPENLLLLRMGNYAIFSDSEGYSVRYVGRRGDGDDTRMHTSFYAALDDLADRYRIGMKEFLTDVRLEKHIYGIADTDHARFWLRITNNMTPDELHFVGQCRPDDPDKFWFAVFVYCPKNKVVDRNANVLADDHISGLDMLFKMMSWLNEYAVKVSRVDDNDFQLWVDAIV